MSNQMIPAGALPTHLAAYVEQQEGLPSDMAEAISTGFASISYRGKVWRRRVGGEATPITYQDQVTGQLVPSPHIDVVIVAANSRLSKTFYKI